MKTCCACWLMLLTLPSSLWGQSYFYNETYYDRSLLLEAGISLGAMNCLTDLGGQAGKGKAFLKDLNLSNTRLCAGIYAGLTWQYFLEMRFELSRGEITGADSLIRRDETEARHRRQRNLHFRSPITECSLLVSWYPLSLFQATRPGPFQPYLLGGATLFHFNPQACWKGKWIDLQPLHTEGQGFAEYADRQPYARTQIGFPIGAGFRYELSARVVLRLEWIHRLLQTDYLDDVSTTYIRPGLFEQYLEPGQALAARNLAYGGQSPLPADGQVRGNPRKKDSYASLNLKIGLLLNRQKRR